jgi:hypothetical protein
MSRRRLLLFTAFLLASVAVCLLPLGSPRRTVIDPSWSPTRFAREFVQRHPGWEFRRVPRGEGVILRRTSQGEDWDALLELAMRPPARFCERPGRLFVFPYSGPSYDPHENDLDPVTVRGHPDGLSLVLDTFRR